MYFACQLRHATSFMSDDGLMLEENDGSDDGSLELEENPGESEGDDGLLPLQ